MVVVICRHRMQSRVHMHAPLGCNSACHCSVCAQARADALIQHYSGNNGETTSSNSTDRLSSGGKLCGGPRRMRARSVQLRSRHDPPFQFHFRLPSDPADHTFKISDSNGHLEHERFGHMHLTLHLLPSQSMCFRIAILPLCQCVSAAGPTPRARKGLRRSEERENQMGPAAGRFLAAARPPPHARPRHATCPCPCRSTLLSGPASLSALASSPTHADDRALRARRVTKARCRAVTSAAVANLSVLAHHQPC